MAPLPELPRARRPRGPLAESALPVLAWLLLCWLTRQAPCVPGACGGAAGGRWVAMALTLASALLAPGWMLWRLLGPRGAGACAAAAFSVGLGLSWLVATAAAVLWLGGGLEQLVLAVSVQNAALTLVFIFWTIRTGTGSPGPPGGTDQRGAAWPAVLSALALAALVATALHSTGFTHGGDEWFYLRATRQFLDGRGWIFDFEPWELVLALLVRLAGVDLLEAYRVLLPPFLIGASALSLIALGETVLGDRAAALFAFVLQALYCLSDMQARGSGAGMALLRVTEDKYAALLLLLPLVQAAALLALRGRRLRFLALAAALAVAGELVHPLTAVWLAASLLVPVAAWARERRSRPRPAVLAVTAVSGLVILGLGLALRSIRGTAYFSLQSGAALHDRLLNASRRELLVLALDRGWYMGDPRLLSHPLLLASLAAALWLALRREHPSRAFLAGAMAVPLLVVFVPPLPMGVGAIVSPWVMPRLLWALPVSLTLAALLHDRLAVLRGRSGRPSRTMLTWTVALAALAALLAPRIASSLRALHQRNHLYVSDGERELQEFVATAPPLAGNLLAPTGLSIRMPAWTSRVRPLPGPDVLRGSLIPEVSDGCRRLLDARAIGDEQAALLRTLNVGRVVARNGSVWQRKMERLAPAFYPLFHGRSYSVYWWRAERWPEARAVQAQRAKGASPGTEAPVASASRIPCTRSRKRGYEKATASRPDPRGRARAARMPWPSEPGSNGSTSTFSLDGGRAHSLSSSGRAATMGRPQAMASRNE